MIHVNKHYPHPHSLVHPASGERAAQRRQRILLPSAVVRGAAQAQLQPGVGQRLDDVFGLPSGPAAAGGRDDGRVHGLTAAEGVVAAGAGQAQQVGQSHLNDVTGIHSVSYINFLSLLPK